MVDEEHNRVHTAAIASVEDPSQHGAPGTRSCRVAVARPRFAAPRGFLCGTASVADYFAEGDSMVRTGRKSCVVSLR